MLGLGLATSKGGFVDVLAEVTNTKSIDFDGTDDKINLGDFTHLNSASAFTVSMWVKSSATNVSYGLMSKYKDGNDQFAIRFISDQRIFINIEKDNDGFFAVANSINADTNWHNIVLVFDGSGADNSARLKLYKDGQAVTLSYTNNIATTTADLSGIDFEIGDYVTEEFAGNMDEIAFWSSALSATEVAQIYNNNKATLDLSTDTFDYSSSANLKMWLRMGDEASTRVLDTNANNLVIPDMRKTFFSGKSIDFDGSNDYIEAGVMNSGSSFTGTFSAWVYRETTDTGDFIYDGRGASNGGSGYFRFLADDGASDDDKLDSQGSNTIYVDGVATTTCSAGVWHHVVVAGQTIHVNEDIKIGASKSGGSNFIGKICDVAIFNTELDANTVASIYNSGEPNNLLLSASYTAGSGVDKTGNLQAYYRMGNGTIDDFTLIGDQTDTSLQSNIIDSTKFFREEDGTSGGWTPYGSNSVSITSDSVTIAYGSHTYGAKLLFKQTGANSSLTEDLVVDQVYKFFCTISSLTDGGNMRLNVTGASVTSEVLSNGDAVIYFRASHATSNTLRLNGLNSGETVTISNPSLQKVNGNAGLMINMSAFDVVDHAPNRNSGDMINFDATADIETDTPVQIYTVANTKSVLLSTDDFINFGDQQLMTTAGTVSVWTKFTAGSTIQTLVGKYNATNGDREFWLNIQADEKPEWNVQSAIGSYDANTKAKSGTALSEDTWNHIVGTFSANNAPKLYVNGVLVATASSNIDADGLGDGDEPIFIGKNVNGTTDGDFLNGNIDEVAIWNVELSASQVAQIYHGSKANFDLSQNGGGYTSASNLQAWWRMGDGTIDDFPLIGDQTNATLGSELIPNNGFEGTLEVASSTGDVDKWLDANGNAGQTSTVSLDTSNPRTGSNCLKVTLGNVYGYLNYVLNTTEIGVYKFSFFYRAGDSQTINSIRAGGTLSLRAFQLGDSGNQSPVDETYREMVVYFQNTAVQTIRLSLQINGTTGDFILIDDMSCKKVQGNAGFMNNMTSGAIETDTP